MYFVREKILGGSRNVKYRIVTDAQPSTYSEAANRVPYSLPETDVLAPLELPWSASLVVDTKQAENGKRRKK